MKSILFAVLLFIASFSFAQEKYSAADASQHIGEEAIVVGVVAQVSTPKNGIIYLNIDSKYPDNVFTGVIFKQYTVLFPNAKDLEGKKVEIRGKIEEYRGKPQIVIKEQKQITLITE